MTSRTVSPSRHLAHPALSETAHTHSRLCTLTHQKRARETVHSVHIGHSISLHSRPSGHPPLPRCRAHTDQSQDKWMRRAHARTHAHTHTAASLLYFCPHILLILLD